jgi:AcrR family transcriptional regulator
MNMTVRSPESARSRRGTRPSLLDVAAQVLVADPAASLAEVAQAAGIGRTTLHKHYATREDLLRAVGDRAIDRCEAVLGEIAGTEDPDGGLSAVVTALIPIGPQLAFLWRTPAFDHVKELEVRWGEVQDATLAILARAQGRGVVATDVPDWWLLSTFFSLVYVAAESVQSGHLAPLDASGFVLRTFLHGIGAAPAAERSKP